MRRYRHRQGWGKGERKTGRLTRRRAGNVEKGEENQ